MKDQLVFDTADAGTILDSDSVGAFLRSDDGTLITHTTDGAREAIDVFTELGQLEDTVHGSGDIGVMALGVRNDAGTALAADGDYIPLSTDATGALRVNATVNTTDAALADTAIAHATLTLGVADTAEDAVASPLADRKYLWIYNKANQKIFIGASGVTAATGFPISPGSVMEMRAGDSVDIEFVGSSGKTPEIRTLELS